MTQPQIGDTFGVLTVRGRLAYGRSGHYVLLCVCVCGKEVKVDTRYAYRRTSCGCRRNRNSFRFPVGAAAENKLFHNYQINARNKGLPFELTREQFIALVKKRCYYCGAEPVTERVSRVEHRGTKHALLANGIDRENAALGYVLTNCRPCCPTCNLTKRRMTAAEYFAHCVKVAANAGGANNIFDS